jgi:hypothetical protein
VLFYGPLTPIQTRPVLTYLACWCMLDKNYLAGRRMVVILQEAKIISPLHTSMPVLQKWEQLKHILIRTIFGENDDSCIAYARPPHDHRHYQQAYFS